MGDQRWSFVVAACGVLAWTGARPVSVTSGAVVSGITAAPDQLDEPLEREVVRVATVTLGRTNLPQWKRTLVAFVPLDGSARRYASSDTIHLPPAQYAVTVSEHFDDWDPRRPDLRAPVFVALAPGEARTLTLPPTRRGDVPVDVHVPRVDVVELGVFVIPGLLPADLRDDVLAGLLWYEAPLVHCWRERWCEDTTLRLPDGDTTLVVHARGPKGDALVRRPLRLRKGEATRIEIADPRGEIRPGVRFEVSEPPVY